MNFFKNNIKSITVTDSNFSILLKYKNKIFDFSLDDFTDVFIGFNKINFLIFDFITIIIMAISVTLLNSSVYLFFIGTVIMILRWAYLFNNRKYFISLSLKNGQSHIFYFSNSMKYNLLEKVKIIRGNINTINFLQEKYKKK